MSQMGESLPPARVPVKVSRGIDGHKNTGWCMHPPAKTGISGFVQLALSGPCLAPAKEEYGVALSVLPCSDATNVPQAKGTFKDI